MTMTTTMTTMQTSKTSYSDCWRCSRPLEASLSPWKMMQMPAFHHCCCCRQDRQHRCQDRRPTVVDEVVVVVRALTSSSSLLDTDELFLWCLRLCLLSQNMSSLTSSTQLLLSTAREWKHFGPRNFYLGRKINCSAMRVRSRVVDVASCFCCPMWVLDGRR